MVRTYKRDHFFYKAKQNGHLARSYYKLAEADRKFGLVKPNMRVLDLGCSPGSWVEYCVERIRPRGIVVGVDRNEPARAFERFRFLQADIFEVPADLLLEGQDPFDLVLSDMAPDTTGSSMVDSARSFALSTRALELCDAVLKGGGTFFCKIFQGEDFRLFLDDAKRSFATVRVFKPQSSKKESRETYVVGLHHRPSGKMQVPQS